MSIIETAFIIAVLIGGGVTALMFLQGAFGDDEDGDE